MLDRVFPLHHLVLEPKPAQNLGRFAGERFADVKTGKFFPFQNDRGNPLPEQEHRRRRATGAPANN